MLLVYNDRKRIEDNTTESYKKLLIKDGMKVDNIVIYFSNVVILSSQEDVIELCESYTPCHLTCHYETITYNITILYNTLYVYEYCYNLSNNNNMSQDINNDTIIPFYKIHVIIPFMSTISYNTSSDMSLNIPNISNSNSCILFDFLYSPFENILIIYDNNRYDKIITNKKPELCPHGFHTSIFSNNLFDTDTSDSNSTILNDEKKIIIKYIIKTYFSNNPTLFMATSYFCLSDHITQLNNKINNRLKQI